MTGTILHLPLVVTSNPKTGLIIPAMSHPKMTVFFKLKARGRILAASIKIRQQAPLSIKLESDSTPFLEDDKAIKFLICANEFSSEGAMFIRRGQCAGLLDSHHRT